MFLWRKMLCFCFFCVIGMMQWYDNVPFTVTAFWNLVCNFFSSSSYSLLSTNCNEMLGRAPVAHWNNSFGVWIGFPTLWRLVLAANLFNVPPKPSHAPLPWDVGKKCHSAAIPKSCWWWIRLAKFFLFLYWALAPSEK